MTGDTETQESSLTLASRLQLVYVAGIALNAVALSTSAIAGEWLIAGTFGVVIAYLCLRYWMIATP